MGYIGAGVTRFNTADELTVTGDAQIDGNTLVVDSTNNRVGVNNASPSTALDVTGNITSQGSGYARLDLNGTTGGELRLQKSGTTYADIYADSTDGLSVDSDKILFKDSGTERMRIDSSGNVGIGTASPNSILHTRSTAPVLTVDSSAFASSGDGTGFGIYRSASGRVAGYTWTIENAIRAGGGGAGEYQTDDLLFKGRANTTDTTLTERMRIDSSGNVGIGTASPSELLHVQSSGDIKLKVETTNTTASSGHSGLSLNTGNGGYLLQNLTTVDSTHGVLRIYDTANSAERMRIDSSGNLLVGKTSSSFATAGGEIKSNGQITATASNAAAMQINRKSNDGTILNLAKDGTAVRTIGTDSGDLTIDGATSHSGLRFLTTYIQPRLNSSASNGGVDLGTTVARFKDLYLSGGVYLGGTGSANKLDDYEEGTWTPSFYFSGGVSGLTHAIQNGSYVKVGRLVTCSIEVQLSALGSATGNAVITGLPFTSSSVTGVYGAFLPSYWQSMSSLPGESYTHAVDGSSTAIQLRYATGTTSAPISHSYFTNSSRVLGIVTYYTDA